MADYVLTERAADDLDEIYAYSFKNFGEAAADEHLLALHDCFRALAKGRLVGRSADDIQSGLYKHRLAKHVVFYLPDNGGILVVRTLHAAMDFSRHLDSGAV